MPYKNIKKITDNWLKMAADRSSELYGGLLEVSHSEKKIKHVIDDLEKVERAFTESTKDLSDLNGLIIAEAPQSHAQYFYRKETSENENNTFLNPAHFDVNNREDLKKLITDKKLMVFDVCILPLPSIIYDQNASKKIFKEEAWSADYKDLLDEYWSEKLKNKKFDPTQLKFFIRYAKVKNKRIEWDWFKDWYSNKYNCSKAIIDDNTHDIYKNYEADPDAVKKLFKKLI